MIAAADLSDAAVVGLCKLIPSAADMTAVRKAAGKLPISTTTLSRVMGTAVRAGWFDPAAVADVPVRVRREIVNLLLS